MPLHVGSRYAATLGGRSRGIPRRGLVAHYDFHDGAGQTLSDISGNGYHGTLGSTGGVDTNDPTWGSGYLQSDGVDDFAKLPAVPIGATERTFIAVASILSTPASLCVYIDASGAGIYQGYNTHAWFASEQFGGVQKFLTGPAYTLNTPTFNASICGVGRFDMWVNLSKSSVAVSGSPDPAPSVSGLFAFNVAAPSLFANVRLYTVLIYNVALTDGEIRQTYRAVQRILAGRGITL